ncbi:MAG: hypothetical protein ACEQSX_00780 [Baekduiaceae bacterium]
MVRNRTSVRGVAALAAATLLGVLGLVALLLLADDVDRPTVPAVVAAAQRPADSARTLASAHGVPFPDWRAEGWRPVGSRTDALADDREAVTVRYRRGDQTVAYTVVSGTGNVDDETAVFTTQVGDGPSKIELVTTGTASTAVVKRQRNGRTVLLSARPESDATARMLRRLAVRG